MPASEILVMMAMVAGFVAVHLLVGRLRFLDSTPRSKWLSFAGGTAVAYVFLHVLPELAVHQRGFAGSLGWTAITAETAIYSLALAGLAVFYGLERAVKVSRAKSRGSGQGDEIEDHVQYLHLLTYGTLNLLVGYLLLHREEGGEWALALYFTAMALHFVTADFGMRENNPRSYDRVDRWVISVCVVAGWLLGLVVELSPVVVGGLFAFLAGGIVLNVLKEELPEHRQSYFLPFLGGALLYSVLVVAERHWT